jgi:membrane protein
MISNRFFRFFRHLNLKTIGKTIVDANRQRLPGLAAEMAYNAMLSLFPAILTVLTAIGLFAPLNTTFQILTEQLSEVAPEEVLWLVQGFAEAVSTGQNTGLFSLSFALAVWASSGALNAAMVALDQIQQTPSGKVRPFWKARLVALGLTIGAVALLILAVALVFISDVIVRNVAQNSGTLELELLRLWQLLTLPLVLAIMSTLFAFIYRFGPSRWNVGQPIMPGAVLAAIFWAIVSNLFRLYVQYFGNYNQVYGVVGAVIVLLLWLYMSSLMLLIGGQLNVTVGNAMQRSKYHAQTKMER